MSSSKKINVITKHLLFGDDPKRLEIDLKGFWYSMKETMKCPPGPPNLMETINV